ncbi:MAG: hypothetical protein AAFU86_09255, partial [Pseudomonadota bacterium]
MCTGCDRPIALFCRPLTRHAETSALTVARTLPRAHKRGMLSYQHIYHAGNLADVHKHALLAWM